MLLYQSFFLRRYRVVEFSEFDNMTVDLLVVGALDVRIRWRWKIGVGRGTIWYRTR